MMFLFAHVNRTTREREDLVAVSQSVAQNGGAGVTAGNRVRSEPLM